MRHAIRPEKLLKCTARCGSTAGIQIRAWHAVHSLSHSIQLNVDIKWDPLGDALTWCRPRPRLKMSKRGSSPVSIRTSFLDRINWSSLTEEKKTNLWWAIVSGSCDAEIPGAEN